MTIPVGRDIPDRLLPSIACFRLPDRPKILIKSINKLKPQKEKA
jgi:hypothetical protein